MEIMKEQVIHTLCGDVQSCGMDGLSKRGIRELLFSRYVHDKKIPITAEEFDSVLDEEYAKVKIWRKLQQKAKGGNKNG